MEYDEIFSKIIFQLKDFKDLGSVASYIPELKLVDLNKFGVHLSSLNGDNYSFGDSNEKFSIQSISKVLSLSLAFKIENDNLWKRVGVEPSGTLFNSLVQLEYDKDIPRNPFINAGAIVITDVLISNLSNLKKQFIEFVRKLSGNVSINYSEKIAE